MEDLWMKIWMIPTHDISEDSSEPEEGRPVDEDGPSDSNEDKATATDLSNSSKPREGKEKEINEDEEDCDGAVMSTKKQCLDGSKCNIYWCKSKDTGKKISFACYFPVPNNHTHPNKHTPPHSKKFLKTLTTQINVPLD